MKISILLTYLLIRKSLSPGDYAITPKVKVMYNVKCKSVEPYS